MHEFSPIFPKQFTEKRKPLLMAHRGNRVLFPENTFAAFRQAFVDGADVLKTDLHLSMDGEFICIHDATVDRTTKGTGKVKDISLDDLKFLRTVDAQSQPTEHQIPTLEETAGILPNSVALALELKTDRFLEPSTCQRLGFLLMEKKVIERTIALSFSLPRLQALKNAVSEIPIRWISMTHLPSDKLVDLIGTFWPGVLSQSLVCKLRASKRDVCLPSRPHP